MLIDTEEEVHTRTYSFAHLFTAILVKNQDSYDVRSVQFLSFFVPAGSQPV